jgi:hypothetical protein
MVSELSIRWEETVIFIAIVVRISNLMRRNTLHFSSSTAASEDAVTVLANLYEVQHGVVQTKERIFEMPSLWSAHLIGHNAHLLQPNRLV